MNMQARPNLDPASVEDHSFQIESITKIDPPPETPKATWHRYVITQGENVITGQREGSMRTVKAAVEEIVERLNERRRGKGGGYMRSTKKKKAAAKK